MKSLARAHASRLLAVAAVLASAACGTVVEGDDGSGGSGGSGGGGGGGAGGHAIGQVFALQWDEVAMVEQIGTVDVRTAAFSPIADIPGVTAINGEVVLDPAARTYSFARAAGPGEPQESSYVTVDLDTGDVVSEVPIGGWFNNPEHDPVTGEVFALRWDEVAMVEQIGTVDVATAVFSPIADIPGVTMMSGQVVLDPVARTYSFVRSPAAGEPQESSYVTVDIDTGEVIANAPIVEWFNDPQYDPETGQVFALRWDSAAMVEQLVTVEVTTAAFSPVVDIPGVTAVSGEVVLDPVGRTYSFVRSAGPGEPQESSYVTVDIDSGAVVSVAPIVDWFNYPRAVR